MKSIILHVHADAGQESRLQAAFDLARAFEGHISCLEVTPLHDFVTVDPFGGALILPEDLESIREGEMRQRKAIEDRMIRENVSWDWRHVDGDIARSLLSESRLGDIMVLSQAAAKIDMNSPLPLVAEISVHARCPVLSVPAGLSAFDVNGTAMVAWNGSTESCVALRSALPLLKCAQTVHVVTVSGGDSNIFPATQASEYLSRHGIASELHEWPKKDRTTEEALLAAITELETGWLVMGAFGHSRLRETIFGGVTRFLLSEARIPLLLAH